MIAAHLVAWEDHGVAGVMRRVMGHTDVGKANAEDHHGTEQGGKQRRPFTSDSRAMSEKFAASQSGGCDVLLVNCVVMIKISFC